MGKKFLKSMLAGESRAYGFTISFWGSGAILVNQFGAPGLELALMYGIGGITGFGILALGSFGGVTKEVEDEGSNYLALGTIHYLASLLPIVATSFIANNLEAVPAFFLGGLSVSLMYNLLALVEEDLSEMLKT